MNPEDNQKRAQRRAKANVRRDLYEMQADRLLTLTYRENMQDPERARVDLQEFERRVRKHFPNWKSIGVWERQERGALHIHLGMAGYHDVNILRDCWKRTVGEGSVNISFKPDGRGNCHTKLASYMTKYITKEMEGERQLGEHRYHRTRNFERRVERYYLPARGRPPAMVAYEVVRALLGRNARLFSFSPQDQSGYGYMEGEEQLRQPSDG